MADTPSKAPAKPESRLPERALGTRHPFFDLRREIERLFDDFNVGTWRRPGSGMFDIEPFWRGDLAFGKMPAVDIAEHDKDFEITAELPGMEEKDIDVKFADGVLSIKGEKKEETEEKKKDYYISERRFGSFQRSFQVPDGVDADKIEASFKNGVLTVKLPKSRDAEKREKKIAITKG
jgi:HSP20 family protein